MKLIAFTGVQGVGQTFMEWSFHYLTGQKTYWSANHGNIPLVDDPTTHDGNAHGHTKNHPWGLEGIKEFVAKAKGQKESALVSCYPQVEGIMVRENTIQVHDEILSYLKDTGFKIFSIELTKLYPYLTERTGRNEKESAFLLCESLNKGPIDVDPNDIVTLREMISLKILRNRRDWLESLQPFYQKIDSIVDRSFTDHEWRTETERCIRQAIECTGMAIDGTRFEKWLSVMLNWREPHQKMVQRYEKDIHLIVRHIIKNDHLDLQSYNLGIIDQSLIIAHLMKDHGRRLLLKSENFPKNAKIANSLLK